jgi:hypothetical protein
MDNFKPIRPTAKKKLKLTGKLSARPMNDAQFARKALLSGGQVNIKQHEQGDFDLVPHQKKRNK